MKEYRIKARSADHRRAIIGALEGMGLTIEQGSILNVDAYDPDFTEVCTSDGQMYAGCDSEQPTHTSLDSLLEDIERDRRTVEVITADKIPVYVDKGDGIYIGRECVHFVSFADFDAIAAAVKQVRGE